MSNPVGVVPESFKKAQEDLKTAISGVATVVADLRGKISVSMSADEVAEAQAVMDSMTATLNALAADPNAPPPVLVGFKK